MFDATYQPVTGKSLAEVTGRAGRAELSSAADKANLLGPLSPSKPYTIPNRSKNHHLNLILTSSKHPCIDLVVVIYRPITWITPNQTMQLYLMHGDDNRVLAHNSLTTLPRARTVRRLVLHSGGLL